MRFNDDFLNEIKDRVRLSDYVGRKVKLVRSGRHMKGLSPFKPEKTPSFLIDDDKRSFVDYSTGISGDIISFIQETEGLSFTETVTKLAEIAGLDLPTETPGEARQMRRRKSLLELMEAAVAFFEAQLVSGVGREARDYLKRERRLPEAAWSRHRIGYAPDAWQGLRDHLVAQGATDDELIEIGLVRASKKSGKPPYDAFRNRVIFPILDATGRPIALGGRALESKALMQERGIPKYINSDETPLFRKSSTIYAYGPARDALGRQVRSGLTGPLSRGLVVVEGYMDVIAMAENDFSTAVAPMGTALTEEQLQLLWRVGPEPIMCFDGDSAGIKAAQRAVDLALPLLEPGRSIYVTILPDGKDPDDLLQLADGRSQMQALLEGARPLIDLLWERERDREALDTPERKAGFEARLGEHVKKIQHPQVQKAYERELKDRFFEHFRSQWQARRQARASGPGSRTDAGHAKKGRNATPEQQREAPAMRGLMLLLRAVDNPQLLDAARDDLVTADFFDEDLSAIRDAALDVQDSCGELDRSAIAAHLRSLGRTRSANLLEEYPRNEPTDLGTAEGKQWLDALERFPTVAALRDEVESADDAEIASENGVEEFAAFLERRKQLVAERQAFKKRGQDDFFDDPAPDVAGLPDERPDDLPQPNDDADH